MIVDLKAPEIPIVKDSAWEVEDLLDTLKNALKLRVKVETLLTSSTIIT